MKQRITYLVDKPEAFSPELLDVKATSFSLKGLPAAKEHRITFSLSELPKELSAALEKWHEFHIRWASQQPYPSIPPFTSRVTPGLHVFFTPHKDQYEGPLCDVLHTAFGSGLKCSSTSEASTKLPILSERFSMSASNQYYAHLPSLRHFVDYLRTEVCRSTSKECKEAAESLLHASYVDLDYDTISHAVIVTGFWATAPKSSWTESIHLPSKPQTIEVGVLTHDPNPDPEDIAFSGFLTVLGQDEKPKPTQFQTPTRHYPLSATTPLAYTASFQSPTGLHPVLTLSFPSIPSPPDATCKLHTHLTLPSPLFVDNYQFTDPLFLSAHNLAALRSISGATDLEAPDWVVPQWGSAALFELAVPDTDTASKPGVHSATIPLHLRYLPANHSSHTPLPVAWPVVFWACRAEEGAKMASSPFDRVHLGYEALFGPKTRFMHGLPQTAGKDAELVEWVQVPVLDLRRAAWVEWGTVGTVVVAFLGLCWVLFGRDGGHGKNEEKAAREGKKKQ